VEKGMAMTWEVPPTVAVPGNLSRLVFAEISLSVLWGGLADNVTRLSHAVGLVYVAPPPENLAPARRLGMRRQSNVLDSAVDSLPWTAEGAMDTSQLDARAMQSLMYYQAECLFWPANQSETGTWTRSCRSALLNRTHFRCSCRGPGFVLGTFVYRDLPSTLFAPRMAFRIDRVVSGDIMQFSIVWNAIVLLIVISGCLVYAIKSWSPQTEERCVVLATSTLFVGAEPVDTGGVPQNGFPYEDLHPYWTQPARSFFEAPPAASSQADSEPSEPGPELR